jgi:hypothetical protein
MMKVNKKYQFKKFVKVKKIAIKRMIVKSNRKKKLKDDEIVIKFNLKNYLK